MQFIDFVPVRTFYGSILLILLGEVDLSDVLVWRSVDIVDIAQFLSGDLEMVLGQDATLLLAPFLDNSIVTWFD